MNKLRWFFGPCFIVLSIASFQDGFFLAGLFLLISGLISTPVTGKIIFQKLSIENKIMKFGIFFIALFIGLNLYQNGANKGAEEDISKVNNLIKEEKFSEALTFINNNKTKHRNASGFTSLGPSIEKAQDLNAQKNSLINMTDDEFQLLSKNSLQKNYFESQELNEYYINQLFKIKDQRAPLIAQKRAEEAKARRKKEIESQFSAWDGSHIEFTKLLKDQMNNPSSFEHVQTRYIDNGETLQIITTYRGTNAFGGVVSQTNSANYDLDGNLINIVY